MEINYIAGEVRYSVYFEPADRSPLHAKVSVYFPTEADAKAFAAQFPKSVRLSAGPMSGLEQFKGWAGFSIQLRSDNKVGTVNETGIKRLKTFFSRCVKLSVPVVYVMNAGNSYPEAEGRAAVGQ